MILYSEPINFVILITTIRDPTPTAAIKYQVPMQFAAAIKFKLSVTTHNNKQLMKMERNKYGAAQTLKTMSNN